MFKKLNLKIVSVVFTGSDGSFMKCVRLLWLPVVAAQALHGGGSWWLW
jgi:hypothetical protein